MCVCKIKGKQFYIFLHIYKYFPFLIYIKNNKTIYSLKSCFFVKKCSTVVSYLIEVSCLFEVVFLWFFPKQPFKISLSYSNLQLFEILLIRSDLSLPWTEKFPVLQSFPKNLHIFYRY